MTVLQRLKSYREEIRSLKFACHRLSEQKKFEEKRVTSLILICRMRHSGSMVLVILVSEFRTSHSDRLLPTHQ